MDGIIIFADDKIFDAGFENNLFIELCKNSNLPVIAVSSIESLESAIKSISSIKAVIVDWNFKSEFEVDVNVPCRTPYNVLKTLEVYAPIYVYSGTTVEETTEARELIKKYKYIKFATKSGDAETEKVRILDELSKFDKETKNLKLILTWTQVVNQSVQTIFYELEKVDDIWIQDLRESFKKIEDDPSVIIETVIQNLISEKIFASDLLKKEIESYNSAQAGTNSDAKIAELLRRTIYSAVDYRAPNCTGDICKVSENEYYLLVTPECDIKKNRYYEVLILKKEIDMSAFNVLGENEIKKLKQCIRTIKKEDLTQEESETINNEIKNIKNDDHARIFNQPHQRFYVIPFFKSADENFLDYAQIDFQTGLKVIKKEDLERLERIERIKSPYIEDIRQRYLSYKGRIGVLEIPEKIRKLMLNNK